MNDDCPMGNSEGTPIGAGMLSTLRSVPPSRRLVWIVALAALSGVMAILSFVAPSTIRYATLSSADANVAGGGPLVRAGEGPREMTVSIDARGVTDAGQVLFTTDSAGNEGRGLTVQVGDDGRPAVFLTSGPGQDDTQITIPDAQFSLKYSAIGGRATVDVTSQAGTETISGATLIITGVYIHPRERSCPGTWRRSHQDPRRPSGVLSCG